jgi:glutamyl-tRNA reductase
VPTIAAFRRQIEAIRHHEVERALHRLSDLDEHQQAIVIELAHRLTNKFLHQPTVRLRAEAAKGNGVEYSHALNELFKLETE